MARLAVVLWPIALLGSSLHALLTPVALLLMYLMPWIPDGGMGYGERVGLAIPVQWAVALAGTSGLDRGTFTDREVAHLHDVHVVVWVCRGLWLAAVAGLAVWWRRDREGFLQGMRAGGRLTVAVAAAGLLGAFVFGLVFQAFHGALFVGDSWQMPEGAMVLRLFPESFWLTAYVLLWALAAAPAAWLWRRPS